MVASTHRSWESKVLAIATEALGVLAILAMGFSLHSCWDAPLSTYGSDAGVAAPYDLLLRMIGTVALIPFLILALLYIIVGSGQRARGSISRMGLFVGVLSALFAGLLGLVIVSAERKPEWQTRGLWIAGVFGVHAVWVLVCWSGEGNSETRRKILRWIGLGIGLIGLGVLGAMGYRWKNRIEPITLSSYRARIEAVAIDADGGQVATVDSGGTLILWDVHSGKPRWSSRRDLRNGPSDIVFSPDRRRLLSREHGRIMVIDAGTGKSLRSLPATRVLDFAPERPLVALSGPELCLWDIEEAEPKRCVRCADATAALFASYDRLWATCRGRDAAVMWDLPSGQPIEEIPLPAGASFWLSSNDKRVFSHHSSESNTRIGIWREGIEISYIDVPHATMLIAGRILDGRLALTTGNHSKRGDPGTRMFFVNLDTDGVQGAFGGAAVSFFALARGDRYAVTTSLDPANKELHAVRVWNWNELVSAGAP